MHSVEQVLRVIRKKVPVTSMPYIGIITQLIFLTCQKEVVTLLKIIIESGIQNTLGKQNLCT
jgi:hypothetical protein